MVEEYWLEDSVGDVNLDIGDALDNENKHEQEVFAISEQK
jgi:hypothetical protein